MRNFLFGGIRSDSTLFELGITPLRIFTGLLLAFHYGMMKLPPAQVFIERVGSWGFPFPPFFAWSATITEVVGGVLLAIGLFTRPVAALIVIQMIVVLTIAVVDSPFQTRIPGLHYLFVGILFLCIGGGRWSMDALLGRRKASPLP